MKTKKIAIITDTHFGTNHPNCDRDCEIADILIQRAVYRLNRLIKPDVVLVLGDIIDNAEKADAEERLVKLKSIIDKLDAPYIAIPGNHDGNPDLFYKFFDRPDDILDFEGIRFLSFIDREEPGYNASRSSKDIERFYKAGDNYKGPVVALQHVPLFPEKLSIAPYNYVNADDIISVMKETGVLLSVSGHYHKGAETFEDGGVNFVTAPALCESPYPLTVLTIDNGKTEIEIHNLKMDEKLELIDGHVHTNLAYCSENMSVPSAINLASKFGLKGICFNEHSGQLYFERKRYWNKTCMREGMEGALEEENRMADYITLKKEYENKNICFGLELDIDYKGNLLVKENDVDKFDYVTGALHSLENLSNENPPKKSDLEDFMRMTEKLLSYDIDVLVHPFRVFRRSGWETPKKLYLSIAEMLQKYDVAAEINFHTNEPPVEFIRICLEKGVKFSLGSDSHNLAEIGDFAYHLDLLKKAGFNGDIQNILI